MSSLNETPLRDPTAQSPAQGAAYWLATLSDENCTAAERQQFSRWLRASTSNVEEFLKLSTLAHAASRHGASWPERTVESLIAEARASSNVAALESNRASGEAPRVRRVIPWLMAASIAVVAIGAAFMASSGRWQAWIANPAYQTAMGEQRSITLEDGSVVELNTRSRLHTQFSRKLRAVELVEGEAIFRVAQDAQRPFRVRSGSTDIIAVGTAFNVNAHDARTIVTVLEGRVRVDGHEGSAPIVLDVGEQLIVTPAQPSVRLSLPDTEKVISWTQRRLIFEETSLGDAAAEFARYSPRQIHVQDAAIAGREVSGVFDAADPASLIAFLRRDPKVAIVADGDGWIVRGSDSGGHEIRQ